MSLDSWRWFRAILANITFCRFASPKEKYKNTVEFEENNTIPFLDMLIKRYNHTFSTSIYRNKTFTGLYTKWHSFTPRKYKVNLICTLTFRSFRICSSPSLLRSCLDTGVPSSPLEKAKNQLSIYSCKRHGCASWERDLSSYAVFGYTRTFQLAQP